MEVGSDVRYLTAFSYKFGDWKVWSLSVLSVVVEGGWVEDFCPYQEVQSDVSGICCCYNI